MNDVKLLQRMRMLEDKGADFGESKIKDLAYMGEWCLYVRLHARTAPVCSTHSVLEMHTLRPDQTSHHHTHKTCN